MKARPKSGPRIVKKLNLESGAVEEEKESGNRDMEVEAVSSDSEEKEAPPRGILSSLEGILEGFQPLKESSNNRRIVPE